MSQSPPAADQARAELYEVMQQDLPFEEKADRALGLGRAYLGVQNAHLTQIDERIDFWEAIASTDPPDGDFPAGEVLDLQTTYCRRVIEKGSSIALSDAPNQGWADDPAFEEHGLHCYHGTPLTVEGEVFGTVCFVSEDPREDPFSERETLFAELIARMFETELRIAEHETELNLQSNLIGVLSRVLRHNLRNDLNIIRGRLQGLEEQLNEFQLEDFQAVEKIDELVDLANTARRIQSIAGSDLEQQPVQLNSLIENLIRQLQTTHPSAEFSIESPDEIYVEANPSLRIAFEELIENAAKHSGNVPTVTVTLGESADSVDVCIQDNGPGLPEQEQEVLKQGAESPLIHGSGLGLWLSYWIVSNHEGSITAEVTDQGTHVTVTLPRTAGLTDFYDSETLLGQFYREQEKFEALFEESLDPIVIVDDDGHYIEANDRAADIIGLPRREIHGRQIKEFVPDSVDFEQAWSSFLDAEDERDTFPLQRADGTERIVEYSAVTDIVPGQHLIIFRDITERIEQQEELRQTTQQLQAVIEASPDPIIALDREAEVQLWNEAAETVFGYTADEIEGQPITSLDLHTEIQQSDFKARFERAMDGESFEGLVVRRRNRDGDDLHLRISTAPLRDDDGDIQGLMAITQEISDVKRSEERFGTLAENFPRGAVLVFDQDLRYRLAHGEGFEMAGFDPGAFEDQHISEVFDGEILEAKREMYEATLAGESRHAEMQFAGREYRVHTIPITDSAGEVTEGIVMTQDITELKQRERELERQVERLDAFTSVVSHDLRNPLNTASDWLELARLDDDEAALDKVERAHDRMRALIEDLLTIAREGEPVSDLEPVDLADLSQNCWQMVESSDATLRAETDMSIRADAVRLEQVFENLFRNAIQHAGDSVTVTVGALDNGFYVADDGPGIPEEHRERVFENGFSTTEGGTGFGLAIVEEIVHAHDWSIQVKESEAGGAKFEITGVEIEGN